MEFSINDKKIKILSIIALVVAITGMTLGFAAFSTTLNISSSASVTPDSSTFAVRFSTSKDSLVVGTVTPSSKTSGITTSDGTIDNSTNPTIKNLSASFTQPGQYVEYTFYARNEGEYTAYLNNINFIGSKKCKGDAGATDSLVQSACESINITATIGDITYTETTPITGHTLNKKTGEQIKVRFEYESNGVYVDGPFTIKFPDLALVYSTLDDSSIKPALPKVASIVSGDLDTVGSEVCIGEECFYVISSTEDTVTMFAKYNLHVGNNVTWDDVNEYVVTPLSNPTGIQDEDAIGVIFDSDGNNTDFPWIGTTAFSSDSQKGTDYTDYNGSIVEGYVNNYASYLEGLGTNIKTARLITNEELNALGCISDDDSCTSAPNWVYSTSYWSGSAYNTSIRDLWFVDSAGYYGRYKYEGDYELGVRPVIEIPVSEF